jgi:hypothetical protein
MSQATAEFIFKSPDHVSDEVAKSPADAVGHAI